MKRSDFLAELAFFVTVIPVLPKKLSISLPHTHFVLRSYRRIYYPTVCCFWWLDLCFPNFFITFNSKNHFALIKFVERSIIIRTEKLALYHMGLFCVFVNQFIHFFASLSNEILRKPANLYLLSVHAKTTQWRDIFNSFDFLRILLEESVCDWFFHPTHLGNSPCGRTFFNSGSRVWNLDFVRCGHPFCTECIKRDPLSGSSM